MNSIPAAQSEALLREIEQQTVDECRGVVTAAEREAHAVVAHAHAAARLRMHQAVEELRREGLRRLARAKAQIETVARQSAQQRAVKILLQAWPLLADAVVARWRNPAARVAWADGVAAYARDRLKAQVWNVDHPEDWKADEQQNFCKSLGASDDAVTFAIDRDITAGIRIRATDATIDGTAEGLLADRAAVAALLLAEIDAMTIDGEAPPGR